RAGEPRRQAAGVRAIPRRRPQRAAPARSWPVRALGSQPERPRGGARLARAARAVPDRRRRRPRRAPARPPFRAPLAATGSKLTSRLACAIGRRAIWGRTSGGRLSCAIRRTFMRRVLGVRALVAAPLLALMCLAISASGAGAAAPTGTRVVAPRPLIPHGARQLGPVSPSATVAGSVVLQPRDESALTRFISQVT